MKYRNPVQDKILKDDEIARWKLRYESASNSASSPSNNMWVNPDTYTAPWVSTVTGSKTFTDDWKKYVNPGPVLTELQQCIKDCLRLATFIRLDQGLISLKWN